VVAPAWTQWRSRHAGEGTPSSGPGGVSPLTVDFYKGLTSVGVQHLGLGRLQHGIQTAQHHQGQDHPPVLGLLVVPTQKVIDGPDERSVVLDTRLA